VFAIVVVSKQLPSSFSIEKEVHLAHLQSFPNDEAAFKPTLNFYNITQKLESEIESMSTLKGANSTLLRFGLSFTVPGSNCEVLFVSGSSSR